MNYPVELKMKILSENEQGKVGNKLLARNYGLKRDSVRYWVLTNKVHMKIEDKIQTEEKDIADFEIINNIPEFERDSYGCKKKSRYLLENHQIWINYKKLHRLEKKFGLKIHNHIRKHPKDYYVYKEECFKKHNTTHQISIIKLLYLQNNIYM